MVTSRIWFTPEQKAELWERWKQGQSISSISRALDRRTKGGVAKVAGGAKAGTAMVAGADCGLAEASVPRRSKHADIS
ncbi:hypothetical protein ACVWWD_006126 [Mesorhizobium sp. URHB0026]